MTESEPAEIDVPDLEFDELVEAFRDHVETGEHTYRLKNYEESFVGSEACEALVEAGIADDARQAESLGNLLLEAGVFHHVHRDHGFKNDYLFYRFAEDEDHGRVGRVDDSALSWADMLGSIDPADSASGLQPRLPDEIEFRSIDELQELDLEPMDEANADLLDRVHPPAWVDPEPEERYNMVVVGAGTGGLVTASAVAGLGGKVALVEKHLMGGDCLNFGCVPSKALLRAGRAAADVREAEEFGVYAGEVDVDFQEVMERIRSVRAHISKHDSARRFADELGVDVFFGEAEFTGTDEVVAGDAKLRFSKACIATGGRPAVPPIPGLEEVDYRTNLDLFNLTEQPDRLGVVGGGAIGTEMAQAFARLGTEVTLFELADEILPREDGEAAAVVRRALADDGVDVRVGAGIEEVDEEGEAVVVDVDGETLEVDELLVAAGRRPNVADLGLEEAGVDYDPKQGVEVDAQLRTTNSDIYAVGDVATRYKFTHAADFGARIVVRNALFFGRESFDDLLIPWCTYTEPELAHVGLYPGDLEERGVEFETFTRRFSEVDRAIVEGATEGFVRLHVDGDGIIVGATIVGENAGDLIGEVALAMHAGVELGEVADVIHPYPTRAAAIRETGDEYNRTRLTPTVKKLMRGFLAMRR